MLKSSFRDNGVAKVTESIMKDVSSPRRRLNKNRPDVKNGSGGRGTGEKDRDGNRRTPPPPLRLCESFIKPTACTFISAWRRRRLESEMDRIMVHL